MNNLKKLGLTALAGSLVASTAYAGTLEVQEVHLLNINLNLDLQELLQFKVILGQITMI
jgi:hypothetical protein